MSELNFYLGEEHDCSYLDGRQARSVFLDPGVDPDPRTYSALVDHGFRRSGRYLYRPQCPLCDACIPLRLPVAAFEPRRSERRCLKVNADLRVEPCPPTFTDEYFDLYRRYQQGRHRGGGMDEPDESDFLGFLTSPWSETHFFEFRRQGRLLAVAVADRLLQGLSAVYTFFDPEEERRSLGTYAVLWQLEGCRRLGLPWLYLGYWIEGSRKMAYKGRYRGAEVYLGGEWRPLIRPPNQ